jgi:hypothetical protein
MSARRVANRQAVQLPRRRSQRLAQLDAGQKQHLRGNVDAEQASRRASRPIAAATCPVPQPASSTSRPRTSGNMAKNTLLQRKQRIRLGVINLGPGYRTPRPVTDKLCS